MLAVFAVVVGLLLFFLPSQACPPHQPADLQLCGVCVLNFDERPVIERDCRVSGDPGRAVPIKGRK